MIRLAGLAWLAALSAAQSATIDVVVDGIEPAPGTVYVTLCQGGLSGAACRVGDEAAANGGSRRFSFADIPAGAWAVAAYQDLNGNGRLDRTNLGLPLEPYGLSNGAGRRARPDFGSASVAVREPGAAIRVRLGRALPAR